MIFRLPSFDRVFRRLAAPQQASVDAASQDLPGAFGHPHRHVGLGLRPFGRYFECRGGISVQSSSFAPGAGEQLAQKAVRMLKEL